ncbi:hypothetical protein [Oryzicola mucosus]|uniref:Lipoprotein n=1 Tax=Oryzicola mucosus TaxID=2767425 RepID=A0A8J6PJC6_9HYPH|nr:hypothetical protein [Oryzicola mucosus]MBD0414621.1 hypothetical protein [Oryzicola mucosus]
MRLILLALAAPVVFVLSGCTTTADANKQMRSDYIGRQSDAFFARYGPPSSSYKLNGGGTVYSWRGGQTTVTVPAQYKTVDTPVYDPFGSTSTRTSTTITRPDDNTTVTETRTSRTDIRTVQQQVLVSPAREKSLFCEARITADEKGVVTDIAVSRDTDGEGLSLSRCAEVFGAKG